MLLTLVDDLWTVTRPLRFFGIEMGTRMTVVRLAHGGLLVHSPVSLDTEVRAAVEALGPVEAIVAPSLFHHLYVREWTEAFPRATAFCCPGLESKRKDVAWGAILSDSTLWPGEIDQVHFSALPFSNEVILFHRKSQTLISSDFVFNLKNHPSTFTRAFAKMAGPSPGPTLLERVMIRDHALARTQVDRILAWNPERIVLAHGDIVERDATESLRRGYAWL